MKRRRPGRGGEVIPFGTEAEPGEVLARGPAPGLGRDMRRWRTAKGLSLRAAAGELDVPFSYLQKLETGGRAKPPTLVLLQRMAAVYDVPTAEVFRSAGVTTRRIEDAREAIDRAFRNLVLHPRLRPEGMNKAWLDSFSTKQKRQWIEFAQRVQAYLEDQDLDPDLDEFDVEEIMAADFVDEQGDF